MTTLPRAAFALALALVSGPALAGDSWHECTTINSAIYQFDGEQLVEVDGDSRKPLKFTRAEHIVLSEEAGYCQNKAGDRFNWANTVYAVKLDVEGSFGPLKLWAMCEEGGSGFPASDQIDTKCVKEVHTKNRKLVPQYEDLAKE